MKTKPAGRKTRGKKHVRRWASKMDQGVILNLRRKIGCDEMGRSLDVPKKEQA